LNKSIKYLALLSLTAFFGCSTNMQLFNTSKAKLGTPTRISEELKKLPEPKEKVVAAVYKFRDQTGQYKPSNVGASWSTAVTQGATSILMRALEESNWFVPLEREGLSNLLNERKIIRSSRANYAEQTGTEQPSLPPLLFAGIILEGGIISYDANILTGGVGAKYFGVGGSNQYRQDRITIYLRAISTSNGRVLKTVYTSKTILSQMVDVGLFRYVDYQRLLEVEAGYSYNEPIEICVTEAIEKAVEALIIEGVNEGLWELKNPDEINSKPMLAYYREKELTNKKDYFDRFIMQKRGYIGLGVDYGSNIYAGDYADADINSYGGFTIRGMFTPSFSLALGFNRGDFSLENVFTAKTTSYDLIGTYYFSPYTNFTPTISIGTGLVRRSLYTYGDLKNTTDILKLSGGLGLEYILFDYFGLNVGADFNYLMNDQLDGISNGKLHDYYWTLKVGINFYPSFL